MAVTIRDVARAAGVSITTVSLVLNNKGSITLETRERVRRAARELGYSRRVSGGVIQLLGHPPKELASAFRFAVAEYGFTLHATLCSEGHLKPLTREAPGKVAGVVVYGGQWPSDELHALGQEYPCVLLGSTVPSESVDAVWVDVVGAIQRAAEHLVERGHRFIGLVNGPEDSFTSAEKDLGFRIALRHTAQRVIGTEIYARDFRWESGAVATRELLGRAPETTGLIVGERTLGMAALSVLAELGLRIPEDMSVVVYRDSPSLATATPPLTAIDTPYMEIARESVSHLVSRIHHTRARGRRLLLKPRLIVRESVAHVSH